MRFVRKLMRVLRHAPEQCGGGSQMLTPLEIMMANFDALNTAIANLTAASAAAVSSMQSAIVAATADQPAVDAAAAQVQAQADALTAATPVTPA